MQAGSLEPSKKDTRRKRHPSPGPVHRSSWSSGATGTPQQRPRQPEPSSSFSEEKSAAMANRSRGKKNASKQPEQFQEEQAMMEEESSAAMEATLGDDDKAVEAVKATEKELEEGDATEDVNEAPVLDKAYRLEHIRFRDHHTLKAPSDTVHFHDGDVRVYGQRNSQFILEEKDNEVTAKVAKDGSVGLTFLRLLYTLVALLMTGFLLIFCLQLLLFLFLSLTTEVGLTSDTDFTFAKFFGALLSVPLFVYSLACALAIATAFVTDTWGGHSFVNTLSRWKDVNTQWFSFFIFVGIPLIVMICSLFAQSDSWWSITALTWFSAVFAYYCLFAAAVVVVEVMGCLELVRRHPGIDCNDESFKSVVMSAVLLRQMQRLSGSEKREYLLRGSDESKEGVRSDEDHLKETAKMGLYSRLTKRPRLHKWGWYEQLDPPVRLFSIDEVQDIAPYVTANTWSLEKLYCRSRSSRFVAVVNGNAAVTTNQVKSSFYCAILGNIIVVLILISLLVWLNAGAGAIAFCTVVVGLLVLPSALRSRKLYRMWKRTNYAKKNDDVEGDEVLYQVWESCRITKPSPTMCWCVLGLEIIFFYILPLITLFMVRNYAIAVLFLIMGFVSLWRFYFNAAAVLTELGTIDILDEDLDGVTSRRKSKLLDEDYREKHRLNLIVGKISQGRRLYVWIWVFAIVVGVFCLLYLAAFNAGTDDGAEEVPVFLQDFAYIQQDELPYPTCRMGNGLELPNSPETALADYTFLSATAYRDPNVTQIWLDSWFGQNYANDEQDLVDEWQDIIYDGPLSAVSFKLISFVDNPNFAVVSIRGTNNGWDALSDAQLWSAAALAQYVRFVLPIGGIWTPILDNLVFAVSLLESDSLERVSFYKQTTEFVEYLKSSTNFTTVRVTGHSLGGGLSMITGAQTETPAIALSGPNNMISRKTFDPELTQEQLDTYTFNIVPDRDPVPRIDDLANLYQRIDCTAAKNNFVDCHTALRSLCEIIYTCGTNGRPAFCFCTEDYGYAPPIPTGDNSYDDVCAGVPF